MGIVAKAKERKVILVRLVDADALLQRAVSHGWSTPKWVSDIMIEDAPTIEVVRCGECKYSDTYSGEEDCEMPLKCLSIRYGGVYPDWFCEHGKYREEAHDGK